MAGTDDAAGRARQHGAHRLPRGEPRGDDAAGGLHHVHTAAGVLLGYALLQLQQIALHARREIGVDHGGRCALVFAELGQNAMRGGDGQAQAAECRFGTRVRSPGSRRKRAARWPLPRLRCRERHSLARLALLRSERAGFLLRRSPVRARRSAARAGPDRQEVARTSRRDGCASGGQWRWCLQSQRWSQRRRARPCARAWCWCRRWCRGGRRMRYRCTSLAQDRRARPARDRREWRKL